MNKGGNSEKQEKESIFTSPMFGSEPDLVFRKLIIND